MVEFGLSPEQEKLLYGATVGLTLGDVVGNVASGIDSYSKREDIEKEKARKLAEKFNKDFETFNTKNNSNGFFISDANTPEGKRYIKSANKFLDNENNLNNKYYNPYIIPGTAAAGTLLGVGIAHYLNKK